MVHNKAAGQKCILDETIRFPQQDFEIYSLTDRMPVYRSKNWSDPLFFGSC